MTYEGTNVVLAHMDINSNMTAFSNCYNNDVAEATIEVDLRLVSPGIRPGESITVTAYCGNVVDGAFSSHLFVDDVRLGSNDIRLDVTMPNTNTFDVLVSGVVPNAQILTLLTVVPNCPRSAGPAAGLHGSAFDVLAFGIVPPIWANADANGEYNWAIPGIPPGLMFEWRVIELAFGTFSGLSNLEGPTVF